MWNILEEIDFIRIRIFRLGVEPAPPWRGLTAQGWRLYALGHQDNTRHGAFFGQFSLDCKFGLKNGTILILFEKFTLVSSKWFPTWLFFTTYSLTLVFLRMDSSAALDTRTSHFGLSESSQNRVVLVLNWINVCHFYNRISYLRVCSFFSYILQDSKP